MPRTFRFVGLFLLAAVLACSSTYTGAAQANKHSAISTNMSAGTPSAGAIQAGITNGSVATAKPSSPAQELLKVTIGSSRASVTRDGSYGVFADLENVSSEILTITPSETILVVQPEVSQPNACVESETGIFPVQPRPSNAQPTAAEIHLQPNEHYKVFWDLSANGQGKSKCPQQSWLRDYLGFVPGDYAFTVEGIVYAPGLVGQPLMAHTYTETTTLHVSISQILTAIAAFLGALLAYLVVALQPGHDFDRWRPELPAGSRLRIAGVLMRNMFSAGLLGAAVTIVASRLSDTQFPLKVSVNDFWGALTIGFFAYFIGSKFISTIASRFATPPSLPTGGNPAPGNAPAGNPPAAMPAGAP